MLIYASPLLGNNNESRAEVMQVLALLPTVTAESHLSHVSKKSQDTFFPLSILLQEHMHTTLASLVLKYLAM